MKTPGELNIEFRLALIRKFGTQYGGSHAIGIGQTRLSELQRNHRTPRCDELEKLRKFFSDAQLTKFFGKAALSKISRAADDEEQRRVGT